MSKFTTGMKEIHYIEVHYCTILTELFPKCMCTSKFDCNPPPSLLSALIVPPVKLLPLPAEDLPVGGGSVVQQVAPVHRATPGEAAAALEHTRQQEIAPLGLTGPGGGRKSRCVCDG